MLVDPVHLTKFGRSVPELEAVAIFSVLAAGKAALPAARALERLLLTAKREVPSRAKYPFKILKPFAQQHITDMMRRSGIGCYRQKGRTVHELIHSNLDLCTCTYIDLEKLTGIGPKTSRLFLLHTRPAQRIAVLDVHILHHLRDMGFNAPNNTPGATRRYQELEQICLRLADAAGMTPADWDLTIWNEYRERRGQEKHKRQAS